MSLILIVDDRHTNRAIFSKLMMFLERDVVIETMADPEEALIWLESKIPDLIIVDYSMPKMNGAEFTKKVRNKKELSSTPLIIITAYDDNAFELNAFEAGASDFLRSPVDHYDFVSRAKSLLKGSSSAGSSRQNHSMGDLSKKKIKRHSLRVLISEKDDFNRKVMERILTKAGHHCHLVSDSDSTLDALEVQSFDLVLLSTSPDYVEALEMTKLYRFVALGRHHVPIVALIDDQIPNFGQRCIEAGMDHFIIRPASPNVLLDITQRYAG